MKVTQEESDGCHHKGSEWFMNNPKMQEIIRKRMEEKGCHHGPREFGPHGSYGHGPHGYGPHGHGPHGYGPLGHGPHGPFSGPGGPMMFQWRGQSSSYSKQNECPFSGVKLGCPPEQESSAGWLRGVLHPGFGPRGGHFPCHQGQHPGQTGHPGHHAWRLHDHPEFKKFQKEFKKDGCQHKTEKKNETKQQE